MGWRGVGNDNFVGSRRDQRMEDPGFGRHRFTTVSELVLSSLLTLDGDNRGCSWRHESQAKASKRSPFRFRYSSKAAQYR